MLAASPGFTIVAVLSLAIGIGANCAIFSADAAFDLFRWRAPARSTVGSGRRSGVQRQLAGVVTDYVDIRDRSKSFDGLAAFQYLRRFTSDPRATPSSMGMMVSGNLLPLMGVEPTIGRTFRADEDQVAGRDAVVVLGRTMWEQEFGSDAGVLGRSVRINGVPFTVIGVAPESFTGMNTFVRSDFFVPLTMSPRVINDKQAGSLEAREVRNLRLKGRLKAGVTQAQAQSELTAIATDLERAYPATNKNQQFFVNTELQARVAGIRGREAGCDAPRRSHSACCWSRAETSRAC
jgi:ABC-type antimicrobial peptide transport system permease subunit